MIDRVWHLWQLKWGKKPAGSTLDQALPPFPMTVRQTLSINAWATSTLPRAPALTVKAGS